jgi:hypothetical protein
MVEVIMFQLSLFDLDPPSSSWPERNDIMAGDAAEALVSDELRRDLDLARRPWWRRLVG